MKTTIPVSAILLSILLLLVLSAPVGAATANTAQKASVTIHALQGTNGTAITQSQTGKEITGLSGNKGINGLTFTVTRVQNGSKDVANAPALTGEGAYGKTQATAQVNGKDGIAVFIGLPAGTYRVEQTKHSQYNPAIPAFLLEVPLPDPAGGGALYDIHIYPKYDSQKSNPSDEFTKEVKKRTGNEVVWEFSWAIPDNIGNGKILTLTDQLDDRLKLGEKSALAVRYTDRSGKATTLNARHYRVDIKSNTVNLSLNHDQAFTELAKALLPADGKKKPMLTVEITTTIQPNVSGTIYNSGKLEFEDKDGNKETSTPKKDPSVTVEEGTGGLCIYKFDGDTKKPLAGAEFKVFASRGDAQAAKNPVATGTTGADGYLVIDGLDYGEKETTYWIAETKAPQVPGSSPVKSYNLLPGPIEVKVGSNSHLRANRVDVENNLGIMVPTPGDNTPNTPSDPGGSGGGTYAKVPDSGGAGGSPYRLAGILLLVAAGLLWIRRRR